MATILAQSMIGQGATVAIEIGKSQLPATVITAVFEDWRHARPADRSRRFWQ
jgi:hypothetical protein